MIRKCVICKTEFKAKAARVNAKCCSNACRYIYQGMTRKGENNGRWLGVERERICQQCGKPFRCYDDSRKFCGKECGRLGQVRHSGMKHWRRNPESKARGAQCNSKIQQKWAAQVIARDDFTCRHCGIIGVKLHAHHVLPWKEYPEQRADVDNGITLCIKCHRAVHSKAAMENRVNSVNGQNGKHRANPHM